MFFQKIFKIKQKKESGFVAFFISILLLSAMFGVAISSSVLVLGEQKISNNISFSNQAYYAAEAGIEDALIRFVDGMNWTTSYILAVGDASTTIEILDFGNTRSITSNGQQAERFRKVQVAYEISSDAIGFYYGAQVGDGGMVMGNGSEVQGNVFSNGSVTGPGEITGDVIIASSSHELYELIIGGNAIVHNCKDADITGTLYYVTGGSIDNCGYDTIVDMGPDEIEAIPLPISENQINKWKAAAFDGGFESNHVEISGAQTIGPIQIGTETEPKDLTFDTGAMLTITGTVYVTGNITTNNGVLIQLDNNYGSLSGILIADDVIFIKNGTMLNGSGQAGSYMMLLSTKEDTSNPVIDVRNQAGGTGGIFYTNKGLISLKPGMIAREITGYKVEIENNAIVQYDGSLQHINFSSGPSGGWVVADWGEVE